MLLNGYFPPYNCGVSNRIQLSSEAHYFWSMRREEEVNLVSTFLPFGVKDDIGTEQKNQVMGHVCCLRKRHSREATGCITMLAVSCQLACLSRNLWM